MEDGGSASLSAGVGMVGLARHIWLEQEEGVKKARECYIHDEQDKKQMQMGDRIKD
jgi:hypothetical protein